MASFRHRWEFNIRFVNTSNTFTRCSNLQCNNSLRYTYHSAQENFLQLYIRNRSKYFKLLFYTATINVLPDDGPVRSETCRSKKQSHYRPLGFQEVEAPRFQDNRHMKVVRLSALRTGRLYYPGNTPGTHFC
jgi:hypothetical protein